MTLKCKHCHMVFYSETVAKTHVCCKEPIMTNTAIKQVTRFEVNGHLFDTEEAAQQFLCKRELAQFFCESEELFFSSDSSDVDDIAEYIISRKERLIHLLSFIK